MSIKLTDENKEAVVNGKYWPLLSDLLSKWGHPVILEAPENIKLPKLTERLYELSAWGIPWKRTK